eukprot:8210872-Pyramimonas_sp.AAC.1
MFFKLEEPTTEPPRKKTPQGVRRKKGGRRRGLEGALGPQPRGAPTSKTKRGGLRTQAVDLRVSRKKMSQLR